MSTALRNLDVVDVVCQELGPMTLQDAMYVAWNFTGFPCWWNVPVDGATPAECFRKQVRDVAAAPPHQETP